MISTGQLGLGLYAEDEFHRSRSGLPEGPNDRPGCQQGPQPVPMPHQTSPIREANLVLQDVLQYKLPGSDELRSRNRAEELWFELESQQHTGPWLASLPGLNAEDDFVEALERVMNKWAPTRSRRLPIFEEISQYIDQLLVDFITTLCIMSC
ncbi:protein SULFUR DEFICIENCY-INDUCED 1 [Sesamum angolense]|uniref:Protein SULFUR DEFICIENCY-INDUCED 1 n=1 Tax=Sesamum angolense TaxID=2727404 RepID=A0AAE1XAF9_9LAMI|nr:protein SULFUR DEFICIENCY-INDUCED 1 [Sesamum angolense]